MAQKRSHKIFFGYNDNNVIIPLCIRLLKMIVYVKCFDSNQTMSFQGSDNKLRKLQQNMGKSQQFIEYKT